MSPTQTVLLQILLAADLLGPAMASEAQNTCVAPVQITRFDYPLKGFSGRLATGDPITIVALGSSSTAGAGASSPAMAYPARLAVELTRLFPSQPFTILNRGVNGDLVIDMLARFDKGVAAEHPDLVLWQLGTNAVLRDDRASRSDSLIHQGIRQISSIGADAVLIDPQFAPKVIIKPSIEETIGLISAIAEQEQINVFRRFSLMRYWHDVQGIPFEVSISPDGLHMNDWSYGCFSKILAGAFANTAKLGHASGFR